MQGVLVGGGEVQHFIPHSCLTKAPDLSEDTLTLAYVKDIITHNYFCPNYIAVGMGHTCNIVSPSTPWFDTNDTSTYLLLMRLSEHLCSWG